MVVHTFSISNWNGAGTAKFFLKKNILSVILKNVGAMAEINKTNNKGGRAYFKYLLVLPSLSRFWRIFRNSFIIGLLLAFD